MPQQTKAYLKARFSTGMKPSQQDYADLIDSMVHINDVVAVNGSVIDERINDYDVAQKEQSGASTVTTLGDALYALREISATANVQALISSATGEVDWDNIGGKPEGALVVWDEYSFPLDLYAPVPDPVTGITLAKIIQDHAPSNVKAAMLGKKWVIQDIAITTVPVDSPAFVPTYSVAWIRSVRIGVNPRVEFP